MADINTGNSITRGAPGYHVEALPDGQQVLVNDRTGMVAVTNPYTGQITSEIPRSQVPGAGVAKTATGPTANYPQGPATYPQGVTNPTPSTAPKPGVYVPPGGPPQPQANGPSGVTYPSGVTNPAPSTAPKPGIYPPLPPGPSGAGASSQPAAGADDNQPGGAPNGPSPVDAYGNPGTDLYDWYSVNDALRAAGMGDGSWQIAGSSHQPIASTNWVKNPAYDPVTNPDVDPLTNKAGNDYVIGVANPSTGQLVKIHLAKSAPDASGKYSYVLTGREDQGKIDKTNPGYTGIQRESFGDGHDELWGTNSATGAFEKMPSSPANLGNLKGWNDVKQIDNGQGQMVWVGTNPQGQPMQPIPGAPSVNTAKYVPGSIKQVTKNGKQVYVGQNAQTQAFEDIPELGSEPVKQTTTTVGKNVYTTDANGNLVIASAIAQPKEGDDQWVDAGTGYAKHQVFTNGDWHDDTDTPQKTVNPATQRAEGALKPKGTKYFTPVPGSPDTMVEVTADGNGSFTYEPGPNGEPPRTMKIPGIAQPTSAGVAGAGDEFLPQRRDPTTQALLPPEKNINWSPTNVGDRVRQLQDQARQKQQDLHGQVVAGTLSEDAANQQFNDWWNTSIEPSKQEIQLAQQQKQVETARSNLATAQTGADAVLTATAGATQGMKEVGPGFGDFWGKISQGYGKDMPNNMTADDWNKAFVVQNPAPPMDYGKVYEQATAQALAHISPTAAQIATGQPVPTGSLPQTPDLTASLTPNTYVPGGPPGPSGATALAAPVTAPPVAAAPVTAAPVAPPPVTAPPTTAMPSADWAALQAQMAADRAEQLRQSQAQIPTAWNAWGNYHAPAF